MPKMTITQNMLIDLINGATVEICHTCRTSITLDMDSWDDIDHEHVATALEKSLRLSEENEERKKLLKHNQQVQDEIKDLLSEVENFEMRIDYLKVQIEAPCEYCSYDGAYRCEACRENSYTGFNIKDYPR